jgi:hypothetical protein
MEGHVEDERLWNLLQIDQQRISTLDTIMVAIRGWTITLTSALTGLSFSEDNHGLLLAAVVAATLFALLDLRYRTTQLLHADRVNRVESVVIPEYRLRREAPEPSGPLGRATQSRYRSSLSFYAVVIALVALVWATT